MKTVFEHININSVYVKKMFYFFNWTDFCYAIRNSKIYNYIALAPDVLVKDVVG